MKKKLYIHCGYGRTGTSSFQNFCFNNSKKIFENLNLFYPAKEEFVWHGAHHYIMNFNYLNIQSNEPHKIRQLQKNFAKYYNHIKDYNNVLISSENIIWANSFVLNKFKSYFAEYEFVIIISLRNLEDFFKSIIKFEIARSNLKIYKSYDPEVLIDDILGAYNLSFHYNKLKNIFNSVNYVYNHNQNIITKIFNKIFDVVDFNDYINIDVKIELIKETDDLNIDFLTSCKFYKKINKFKSANLSFFKKVLTKNDFDLLLNN